MFNPYNCRCRHAGEPFPISHRNSESTYVNHRFWLLIIFALCSYSLGPALMMQDRQLICEKQIPKALALLSLFLHQHLLMFETAYFILDFLHLRIVLQQKVIEKEKSVQKQIYINYHIKFLCCHVGTWISTISDKDCSMLFRSFSSCARALEAASFSKSLTESPFVWDDSEQTVMLAAKYASGKQQILKMDTVHRLSAYA